MTKRVTVFIIEEDRVIHHTVSNVYEDSNPFNVAIQAIVEQLTGVAPKSAVQSGQIPLAKVKLPETEKPVSLAEMKQMIDRDFVKPKETKGFNIQTLPTIKMDAVLKGSN